MKWIKKIIIGLLFFLLVNILTLLALSYNIKKVVIDGIIVETITEQIQNKEWKEANEQYDLEKEIDLVTDDERIRELLKTPEMQELINKYINITIESMTEEEIEEVEIERDFLEYLKENKETVSEIVGQEVTDEMIDKTQEQMQGKDISKYYMQTIQNTKRSMTKREVIALKGYKVIISNSFRISLFILLVITLGLIAFIQKSYHKWIQTFSKATITSGFIVGIISIIVKLIVSSISKMNQFHTYPLLITGAIMTAVGCLILLIYKIITIKKEK